MELIGGAYSSKANPTFAVIQVRVPPVPRAAHAVEGAGRVDARGARHAGRARGGVRGRRALVEVALAARAAEPARARARLRRGTYAAVQATACADCCGVGIMGESICI